MNPGDHLQGPVESYEILGLQGEGGFGVTYRARRARDAQLVVLKQLRLERLEDWKSLELFEREAHILQSLEHSGIPSYEDFFATDGKEAVSLEGLSGIDAFGRSLILVQQYMEGEDLAQSMARGEVLTTEQVVEVVRGVLEILEYLHGLHPPVVHRDITPKNILRSAAGEIALVDFGAIQHTLQTKTMGGSTSVGTFGYVPIEQAMGQARPASDLYALGVTTLALLTRGQPGTWPIDDATSKVDLAALGLSPVAQMGPTRRRLCEAVDRMIEPLVGARASSADAVLQVLNGTRLAVASPGGALLPQAPHGGLVQTTAPEHPPWVRSMFVLALGGSLGSAGIIYPLNFSNFSETQLVAMVPFWALPAAFGFFGLLSMESERPIIRALAGVALTIVAIGMFFVVLWPAL